MKVEELQCEFFLPLHKGYQHLILILNKKSTGHIGMFKNKGQGIHI